MAASLDKQTLRKLLFTPCKNKEDLRRFIKIFLGLELPDCTVDPESNSNPMDLVYYVYNKALSQDDENFSGVLYYAARDSFKCVEKGTKLLLKNKQLINIEDAKIGDIIWTGFSWQPVNNWIHDGIKDALQLNLENGLQLTTSPIHKVWSWQPNQEPSWKQVSELLPDDLVCVDTSAANNTELISAEEFELGYLIGIIQGDGSTTLMGTYRKDKKHNRITLTTADPYIVDFWNKQCMKYAGRLPTRSKSRPYDYSINSRQFVDFLQKIGLKACYSWEKDIPEICFSSKSYMLGFISGLYDTDGTFVKQKNIVQFQLTAKILLKKLQVMLLSLGINNSFKEGFKLFNKQKHIVHSININQHEIKNFLNCGIRSFVKNKANNVNLCSSPKIYDAHDSIPRSQAQALLQHLPTKGSRVKRIGSKPRVNAYKTTSRFKMLDLVKYGKNNNFLSTDQNIKWNNILNNKWIKVKNIIKTQADFYDLTVENDHSYWSNGIISHNTLSSSIMQLLFALHLDFNCCIAAAIEQQASISAGYLKNWLNKSHFREFIIAENERKIEIARYEHAKTGEILTLTEYEKLDPNTQTSYIKKGAFTQIVVATIKSMNGFHIPLLCLDECDIAPERPIQEGKMMMTTGPKGQLPILLMTSTRKYAFGPVQKEINKVESGESNLKVFHWNLIDVTQSCPTSRHKPEQPKIDLYTSRDKLVSITPQVYEGLPADEQQRYKKNTAFAGCATCKLHPMCMTRLATDQKSTSKILKPIPHVINLFKNVDTDTAKAQLLSWRPGKEGLVYPNFDTSRHMITAAQMATKITGETVSPNFSKSQLLELAQKFELKFYSGMDFGYTHFFAVVTGFTLGNTLFVADVIAQAHLEDMEKVEVCNRRIKYLNPSIFPDPASPQTIKLFRKYGYSCKNFKKDVLGGIEIVRAKLNPGIANPDPEIYLLKYDEGCEAMARLIKEYSWMLDSEGNPTDVPNEKNDDLLDAMRYLCQNLFSTSGKIKTGDNILYTDYREEDANTNWISKEIEKRIDSSERDLDAVEGSRGNLHFKF